MTEPVVHFLPYQKAWIEDQSRFKIGMFARQTGKRDDPVERGAIAFRHERQHAGTGACRFEAHRAAGLQSRLPKGKAARALQRKRISPRRICERENH